ncbi:MAG: hypothetical protein ACMV0Y_01510 [Paludibacter sp.]|jgi:hypothetical protein
MKKENQYKREYILPEITVIALDNEISLSMQSLQESPGSNDVDEVGNNILHPANPYNMA